MIPILSRCSMKITRTTREHSPIEQFQMLIMTQYFTKLHLNEIQTKEIKYNSILNQLKFAPFHYSRAQPQLNCIRAEKSL